jgi:hypothetical protein
MVVRWGGRVNGMKLRLKYNTSLILARAYRCASAGGVFIFGSILEIIGQPKKQGRGIQ